MVGFEGSGNYVELMNCPLVYVHCLEHYPPNSLVRSHALHPYDGNVNPIANVQSWHFLHVRMPLASELVLCKIIPGCFPTAVRKR